MDTQSEFKKVYVNLLSLKKHLPIRNSIEEKFANIYNSELDRLINLGFDVKEFQVPQNEIKIVRIGGNYVTGEKHYSEEKYVQREIFLMKLDATLEFFLISTPETKIGLKMD
jgi:hypothetical protein